MSMKAGVHPLYVNSTVLCACGNTFQTRSTVEQMKIDICSACHPFYTGQQRLVDTAGRVERYQKRFKQTEGKTIVRKPAKTVLKKLENVKPAKHKVLTTAPKKETKEAKSAKKPAKTS